MQDNGQEVKVVENTLADGTKQKLVVVVRNANEDFEERMTFGDRIADAVAQGGGSWTFIIFAGVVLGTWITFNALMHDAAFDPYPFILLNLMLSMLAALQAPIIMMSQNRQALKDRLHAQLDYEINCKAEAGILDLHSKIERNNAELNAKLDHLFAQLPNVNLLSVKKFDSN